MLGGKSAQKRANQLEPSSAEQQRKSPHEKPGICSVDIFVACRLVSISHQPGERLGAGFAVSESPSRASYKLSFSRFIVRF